MRGIATKWTTPEELPAPVPGYHDGSLKELIERDLGIPVGEPTSKAYSVTYEPYITIMSGGIKDQGDIVPCHCSSVETAVELWRYAVSLYFEKKTGGNPEGFVLYWRQEPEICDLSNVIASRATLSDPDRFGKWEPMPAYYVWSRLLISNTQIPQEDAA